MLLHKSYKSKINWIVILAAILFSSCEEKEWVIQVGRPTSDYAELGSYWKLTAAKADSITLAEKKLVRKDQKFILLIFAGKFYDDALKRKKYIEKINPQAILEIKDMYSFMNYRFEDLTRVVYCFDCDGGFSYKRKDGSCGDFESSLEKCDCDVQPKGACKIYEPKLR